MFTCSLALLVLVLVAGSSSFALATSVARTLTLSASVLCSFTGLCLGGAISARSLTVAAALALSGAAGFALATPVARSTLRLRVRIALCTLVANRLRELASTHALFKLRFDEIAEPLVGAVFGGCFAVDTQKFGALIGPDVLFFEGVEGLAHFFVRGATFAGRVGLCGQLERALQAHPPRVALCLSLTGRLGALTFSGSSLLLTASVRSALLCERR